MSPRAGICVSVAMALAQSLAPAAARPPVDYAITPLTAADVDFFLGILRAAAIHNAHLVGEDRQAVLLMERLQRPPAASPDSAQRQQAAGSAKLMARAATLASYDETIARDHAAFERYNAIKTEVEQVVAALDGAVMTCGRSNCGGTVTGAQAARDVEIRAAIEANKPLIAPHEAEIVALKKEIGGFMNERMN